MAAAPLDLVSFLRRRRKKSTLLLLLFDGDSAQSLCMTSWPERGSNGRTKGGLCAGVPGEQLEVL